LKLLAILCAVLLLIACQANPSKPSGPQYENLIQKVPLPDGKWKVYQKNENWVLETMWQHESRKDFVKTFVIYNEQRDIEEHKINDDRIGLESCGNFKSTLIINARENGYDALTWFSVCSKQNGFYTKSFNKVIKGNDSSYMVRRVWRAEPSEQEWQTWKKYYQSIIVCDSRLDESPCPGGYTKVN